MSEWDYKGCTCILVLGATSVDGKTRLGQNFDKHYPMVPRFDVSIFTNKKSGIKVIGFSEPPVLEGENSPNPGRLVRPIYLLNDSGVARTQSERTALSSPSGNPSATLFCLSDRIMQSAHTAREAIDMAEKIAQTGGVRVGKGGCQCFADKDEGYLIEGYGRGHYSIIGPKSDMSFAHSNTIISPALKHLELDCLGIFREQRAQELLYERRCHSKDMPNKEGQITTPYLFRIFRDHHCGWDQTYAWDDRGNISHWGCVGRTGHSCVSEISGEYPDLLSIWWATPNFPPFCPYIPFFIGINEVPPSFASGERNETCVFQELINAVGYNRDYADEVQKFWEAFDNQTVRETFYVARDVKALIESRNRREAQDLLFKFTNEKCEVAVACARALVEKVSKNSIKVKTFYF